MNAKNQPPLPKIPFQHPLRRLVRNGLLIALMAFLFLGELGRPYLRLHYKFKGSYSNKTITQATYWSFGHTFVQPYGDKPLLILVPPEKKLSQHGAEFKESVANLFPF